jgi:sugar/nucleoside kinase (ribokinase family)
MFRGYFPSAKPYDAVVAGSVLVDVIARSSSTDGANQVFDASGTLDEYRIGGCAFNIFVHLSEQRVKPILCSGIKKIPFSLILLLRELGNTAAIYR